MGMPLIGRPASAGNAMDMPQYSRLTIAPKSAHAANSCMTMAPVCCGEAYSLRRTFAAENAFIASAVHTSVAASSG